MEVDKDKLVKYLYERCPAHFYNYVEGDCCINKVSKQTCSLHAFAKDLNCPLDCPRLDAKEYRCDKGKCSKIKGLIKGFKIQQQ